jgi:hypothetical protein
LLPKYYAADESEENRKKIENIASTSILITANAQDLIIKREIPNAAECIENPWINAKLADALSLIGDGFKTAKNSPTNIENIKESIKLSVEGLDYAIEQINNERQQP